MKLLTTIQPRRDGTVTLAGKDGASYVFKDDGAGVLVCDIADEATIAHALALGTFEPAEEADFQKAEELLQAATATDDEADADGGDDDGDDDVDFDAPPVEAGTPPAPVEPTAPAPRRRRQAG